jgi:chromate transport protein ChrA
MAVTDNVLMWLFTILIVIGLFMTYREIEDKKHIYHKFEGPILIVIGLVASVVVGVNSSDKGLEKFCGMYGF